MSESETGGREGADPMSEGSRPPNPKRAREDEQPLARPVGDEELRLARPVSGEQEEEEEATQAQAEQQETTQTEAAKEEGRQVEGEQEEEKGLIEKVKDKLLGQ
jgi:hypothetical protein